MVTYKRRRYLIKKAFQLKYTGIILFFIFLTAAIASATIYFAIFPFLSEKLANVYPQGRLVSVLRSANAKVIVSTAILLPIAAWFGIILSHRIAGPWFRMEMILRDIAEGRLTSEVKLRKGDELKSLADAINEVVLHLRSSSEENLHCLQSLNEALEGLKQEINREPIDLMKVKLLVSRMQDTSYELKALIEKQRLNKGPGTP